MALYHSAKGSVDYTVVGSPTIVDGVASGFSASDYIKTASSLPSNIQTMHLHTKFTITGYSSTGYQGIFMVTGYPSLEAQYNKFRIYMRNTDSTSASYTYVGSEFLLNVPIELDFMFANNTCTYKAIQNGNTILDVSYSSTIISTNYIEFGHNWQPLEYGSIDLKETYITVDGQPWFGVCPIEVKKHQIKGPVGYTVVGSPTIVDGVASGFSGTDYLKTAQEYSPLPDTLEWHFKFNTGTIDTSEYSYVLGFNTHGGVFIDKSTKKIRAAWNNQTDSWVEKNTNVVASDNTDYSVELLADNLASTCTLTVKDSSDTVLFTQTYTSTSAKMYGLLFLGMRGNASYISDYWRGSIDLNETYIKVNGKLWYWQPQETKRIVVNGVTVYTSVPTIELVKVGNPTIQNGIVSDFSMTDYIETKELFDTTGNFTLAVHCTPNDTSSDGMKNSFIVKSAVSSNAESAGFAVACEAASYLYWWLQNNNGANADGLSSQIIGGSSDIWFLVDSYIWNNNRVTDIAFSYYNGDGEVPHSSWTFVSSTNWSQGEYIAPIKKLAFGSNIHTNLFLNGSIDFNKSYVLKDGVKYRMSIV